MEDEEHHLWKKVAKFIFIKVVNIFLRNRNGPCWFSLGRIRDPLTANEWIQSSKMLMCCRVTKVQNTEGSPHE